MISKYSPGIRITSFLTVFIFSLTSNALAQAVSIHAPTDISSETITLNQIKIPADLGSIHAQFSASKKNPFIFLIQDAHAIFDAQKNIQKLIDYLQTQYGINLIALEGSKGPLDPTLLRTFPNESVKKKILNQYLQKGELTAAEMAAVFNPKEALYYGIEDWKIYEENYIGYLKAMQVKDEILKQLEISKASLDLQRKKIYSQKLEAFYQQVENFHKEDNRFFELLKYLSLLDFFTARSTQSKFYEQYPHLTPLLKSIDQENSFKRETFETQVRQISQDFKKKYFLKLNSEERKEFNLKHQTFLTGQSDFETFLSYLANVSKIHKIKLNLSQNLKKLVFQMESLSQIKGSILFEELEEFLNEIESNLITKPEEKEISEKYKRFNILSNLASLELTRQQLDLFQKNPDEYLSLLNILMSAVHESTLRYALEFYQIARQRDQAFLRNLNEIIKKQKTQKAIVIAGGFHTQGLEDSLKAQGFSYLVVSPKMDSLQGKESYTAVMQGQLSYKKYLETSFYDAFMKDSTLKLVNELNEPDFRKNLKLWRDDVVRKLSSEGRVAEAGQYTRYIDFLFKAYYDKYGVSKSAATKEELLKAIEKELDQFRDDTVNQLWQKFQVQFKEFTSGLHQLIDQKALNKQNVSSLINRVGSAKPFNVVQWAHPLQPKLSLRDTNPVLVKLFLNGEKPEVQTIKVLSNSGAVRFDLTSVESEIPKKIERRITHLPNPAGRAELRSSELPSVKRKEIGPIQVVKGTLYREAIREGLLKENLIEKEELLDKNADWKDVLTRVVRIDLKTGEGLRSVTDRGLINSLGIHDDFINSAAEFTLWYQVPSEKIDYSAETADKLIQEWISEKFEQKEFDQPEPKSILLFDPPIRRELPRVLIVEKIDGDKINLRSPFKDHKRYIIPIQYLLSRKTSIQVLIPKIKKAGSTAEISLPALKSPKPTSVETKPKQDPNPTVLEAIENFLLPALLGEPFDPNKSRTFSGDEVRQILPSVIKIMPSRIKGRWAFDMGRELRNFTPVDSKKSKLDQEADLNKIVNLSNVLFTALIAELKGKSVEGVNFRQMIVELWEREQNKRSELRSTTELENAAPIKTGGTLETKRNSYQVGELLRQYQVGNIRTYVFDGIKTDKTNKTKTVPVELKIQISLDNNIKDLKQKYFNEVEILKKWAKGGLAKGDVSYSPIFYEAALDKTRNFYWIAKESFVEKNAEGKNVAPQSLEKWAHAQKRTQAELLVMIEKILDALNRLHRSGIQYRDLTPQNILITAANEVKLTELGSSQLESRLWPTISLPWKPDSRYAPPEMWKPGSNNQPPEISELETRTKGVIDLYSLGIIMFELATGTPYLLSKTSFGEYYVNPKKKIPTTKQLIKQLQAKLRHEDWYPFAEIIAKALNPEPRNRYKNALKMKKDIKYARAIFREQPPPISEDVSLPWQLRMWGAFHRVFLRPFVKVEGIENIPENGAFLLVGDFRSPLDGLLIVTEIYLRKKRLVHFVIKPEYSWRWVRYLARIAGAIIVAPGMTFKKIKEYLDRGLIVGITRTGQIMTDNRRDQPKKTATHLAHETNVPIIPFGVQWKGFSFTSGWKKELFHRWMTFNLSLLNVETKLSFGKPIVTNGRDSNGVMTELQFHVDGLRGRSEARASRFEEKQFESKDETTIAVIGLSDAGLATAALLAQAGFRVNAIGEKLDEIKQIEREPGLFELVKQQEQARRLNFIEMSDYSIKNAIDDRKNSVIYLDAGNSEGLTPQQYITRLHQLAETVGLKLKEVSEDSVFRVFVLRGTVKVGTTEEVRRIIQNNAPNAKFGMAYQPDFIQRGRVLKDVHENQIVIGLPEIKTPWESESKLKDNRTWQILKNVIAPLNKENMEVKFMSPEAAELSKHMLITDLVTKLALFMGLAPVVRQFGGDLSTVALGMGLDKRIGLALTNPSMAFGGRLALLIDFIRQWYSENHLEHKPTLQEVEEQIQNIEESLKKPTTLNEELVNPRFLFSLWAKTIQAANEQSIQFFENEVREAVGNVAEKSLNGASVAVLGVAYKVGTDQLTESSALRFIDWLVEQHVKEIRIYDPLARANFNKWLKAKKIAGSKYAAVHFQFFDDPLQAMKGTDMTVYGTPLDELKKIKPEDISSALGEKGILIDSVNLYGAVGRDAPTIQELRSAGVNRVGFGIPPIGPEFDFALDFPAQLSEVYSPEKPFPIEEAAKKKVAIFGSGYVGLTLAALLSSLGHEVEVVDLKSQEARIEGLKKIPTELPIYEPGLLKLIEERKRSGRLKFTVDGDGAILRNQIIYVAVGTPQGEEGQVDTSFILGNEEKKIEGVFGQFGRVLSRRPKRERRKNPKLIVVKSTVPPNLFPEADKILREDKFDLVAGIDYLLASNPEFLKEGEAVPGSFEPDTTVYGIYPGMAKVKYGHEGIRKAKKELLELTLPLWKRHHHTILMTDTTTSTVIKYGKNSALATRISETNLIAMTAEVFGTYFGWIKNVLRQDPRIGKAAYLDPGCGYGGSCFPKDVRALDYVAKHAIGYAILLIRLTDLYNEIFKRAAAKKIAEALVGSRARGTDPLKGKQVGVIGLTFKANTDDTRKASAITLVIELILRGAKVVLYDPIFNNPDYWRKRGEIEDKIKHEIIKEYWGLHPELVENFFKPSVSYPLAQISFAEKIEDAFPASDAVVVLNEWRENKDLILTPEFPALISQMNHDGAKNPIFMDARDLYDPELIGRLALEYGFYSPGVGRPPLGKQYSRRSEVRNQKHDDIEKEILNTLIEGEKKLVASIKKQFDALPNFLRQELQNGFRKAGIEFWVSNVVEASLHENFVDRNKYIAVLDSWLKKEIIRAKSSGRSEVREEWVRQNVPELYGKTVMYVSPGFKPSPEWLANFKNPEMRTTVANGHQSGGLEPLGAEIIVKLTEMGMNGIGVGLYYANAPVQMADGHIESRQIDYTDAIRAGKLVQLGKILVPVEGKEEEAIVWAIPFLNEKGKSAVVLLLENSQITSIIYPDAFIRRKQMLLLGQGALVLAQEFMNEKSEIKDKLQKLNWLPFEIEPAVIQMNEALTTFAHPESIASPLKEDKRLHNLSYGLTTHTPVASGLQKFPIDWTGDIRINPSWSSVIERAGQLDLTLFAMALADTINAVSKEHGMITVRNLYPDFKGLIKGIVNGIYVPHWQIPEMAKLVGVEWSEDNIKTIARIHLGAKRKFAKFIHDKTGIEPDIEKFFSVEARRKTSFKAGDVFNQKMQDANKRDAFIASSAIQIFLGKPHSADRWGLARVKEMIALSQGRVISVDSQTLEEYEIARDERLIGRVIYIPNFNVAEADIVFQGADALGMYSILTTEASATGYMKGLVNAIPTIASKTGGPLEHIKNGENGIFIEEYDWSGKPTGEGLVNAILSAANLYSESLRLQKENLWDSRWHRMMWNALQTTSLVDIEKTLKVYLKDLWGPAYRAKLLIRKVLDKKFDPEAPISPEDFRDLLIAAIKQRAQSNNVLVSRIQQLIKSKSEQEIKVLLEPISELSTEEAYHQFGEVGVPKVMALVAALSPELLDHRIKNWNRNVIKMLTPAKEILQNGKLFVHDESSSNALAISRTFGHRFVLFPIYLAEPYRIGGPDRIADGKIWFEIFGMRQIGIQQADGRLIGVYDLTVASHYPGRTARELVPSWLVGISIISDKPDLHQIEQPGWGFQALLIDDETINLEIEKSTSVRAEVRGTFQSHLNQIVNILNQNYPQYEKLGGMIPLVVDLDERLWNPLNHLMTAIQEQHKTKNLKSKFSEASEVVEAIIQEDKKIYEKSFNDQASNALVKVNSILKEFDYELQFKADEENHFKLVELVSRAEVRTMTHFMVPFSNSAVDWQTIFGNDNPISIDFGFGRGGFLNFEAESHAGNNYVGIDLPKYADGSSPLLSQVDYDTLSETNGSEWLRKPNIRIILHDGVAALESMFSDGQIQQIYMLFPEASVSGQRPFVPSEHLINNQSPLPGIFARKIKTGGRVLFVSESRDYANFTAAILRPLFGEVKQTTIDTRDKDAVQKIPEITGTLHINTNSFFQKFKHYGLPIYIVEAVKRAEVRTIENWEAEDRFVSFIADQIENGKSETDLKTLLPDIWPDKIDPSRISLSSLIERARKRLELKSRILNLDRWKEELADLDKQSVTEMADSLSVLRSIRVSRMSSFPDETAEAIQETASKLRLKLTLSQVSAGVKGERIDLNIPIEPGGLFLFSKDYYVSERMRGKIFVVDTLGRDSEIDQYGQYSKYQSIAFIELDESGKLKEDRDSWHAWDRSWLWSASYIPPHPAARPYIPSRSASRSLKYGALEQWTWESEEPVLAHFKALFALVDFPLPRIIIKNGQQLPVFGNKPLNIESLRKLAGKQTPAQYFQQIAIASDLPEARSMLEPFLKEFGIWPKGMVWFDSHKQLEAIRDQIQSFPKEQPVKILVHATWNGEDAYAIATMLHHLFKDRTFEITGMDVVEPNPTELNWVAKHRFPEFMRGAADEFFTPVTESVLALKPEALSLVQLKQGDITKPESFGTDLDIIVANGMLGQIVGTEAEIEKSIENTLTALKPGGRFYVDNHRFGGDKHRAAFQFVMNKFLSGGKFKVIGSVVKGEAIYEKVNATAVRRAEVRTFLKSQRRLSKMPDDQLADEIIYVWDTIQNKTYPSRFKKIVDEVRKRKRVDSSEDRTFAINFMAKVYAHGRRAEARVNVLPEDVVVNAISRMKLVLDEYLSILREGKKPASAKLFDEELESVPASQREQYQPTHFILRPEDDYPHGLSLEIGMHKEIALPGLDRQPSSFLFKALGSVRAGNAVVVYIKTSILEQDQIENLKFVLQYLPTIVRTFRENIPNISAVPRIQLNLSPLYVGVTEFALADKGRDIKSILLSTSPLFLRPDVKLNKEDIIQAASRAEVRKIGSWKSWKNMGALAAIAVASFSAAGLFTVGALLLHNRRISVQPALPQLKDRAPPQKETKPTELEKIQQPTKPSNNKPRAEVRQPKQKDATWWRDPNQLHVAVSLPIYALRSRQNDLGIGKFSMIAEFFENYLRPYGIDTILLLPHYAILAESPYAPVSLHALNERYIDWFLIKEVRENPDLLKMLTIPVEQQREVNYSQLDAREREVASKAFELFNLKTERGIQYQQFIKRYGSVWLNDYAEFMALHEIINKSSLEWTPEEIAAAKQQKNYQFLFELHRFAQWIAAEQFADAIHSVHQKGGKVLFDLPKFRAKDSVEVWKHPEYFKDLKEGYPGIVHDGTKEEWKDLALWDWTRLQKEGYKFILAPVEYWLDFSPYDHNDQGFNGGRDDAFHFGYPFHHGQRASGDEPGDLYTSNLAREFLKRGALPIAEAFYGKDFEAQRVGFVTIKQGNWKLVTTHDDPRKPSGVDFAEGFNWHLNSKDYSDRNARFINFTLGDLWGDPETVKVMRERKEGEQTIRESLWRYRIPLKGDPDYQRRVRFNLGPYIHFKLQQRANHDLSTDFNIWDHPREIESTLLAAGESFKRRRTTNGPLEIWASSFGNWKKGNLEHWFQEEWGRDTFISLPGLLLATGQFDEAKEIIRKFAKHESNGLIPNRIPEWDLANFEYNNVDGSLWFIQAIKHYVEATRDWSFANEMLPTIKKIVTSYKNGTGYGRFDQFQEIKMDANDYLIKSPIQATWMDADPTGTGHPFTPRNGKAIEINALWYASLRFLAQVENKQGDKQAAIHNELADSVQRSINMKFWNPEFGKKADATPIFDVIEGDPHKTALRPNMLIAISEGKDIFGPEQRRNIFDAATKYLLTPYGLRTLSYRDPKYIGEYHTEWSPTDKDRAYHQGTVWPWLIGPYIDALVQVRKQEGKPESQIQDEIRQLLTPLINYLMYQSPVASLPEVFDGGDTKLTPMPQLPGGTLSQAWSIAEVLRVLVQNKILAPRSEVRSEMRTNQELQKLLSSLSTIKQAAEKREGKGSNWQGVYQEANRYMHYLNLHGPLGNQVIIIEEFIAAHFLLILANKFNNDFVVGFPFTMVDLERAGLDRKVAQKAIEEAIDKGWIKPAGIFPTIIRPFGANEVTQVFHITEQGVAVINGRAEVRMDQTDAEKILETLQKAGQRKPWIFKVRADQEYRQIHEALKSLTGFTSDELKKSGRMTAFPAFNDIREPDIDQYIISAGTEIFIRAEVRVESQQLEPSGEGIAQFNETIDSRIARAIDNLRKDKSSKIREEAIKTLASFGETAVPALIKALEDEDVSVRHGAAWALGKIGSGVSVDKRTIPALTKFAQDTNVFVQKASIWALGEIGQNLVYGTDQKFDKLTLRLKPNSNEVTTNGVSIEKIPIVIENSSPTLALFNRLLRSVKFREYDFKQRRPQLLIKKQKQNGSEIQDIIGIMVRNRILPIPGKHQLDLGKKELKIYLPRAEMRIAFSKQKENLAKLLLPSAEEIMKQIRDQKSLEALIPKWEKEAKVRLGNKVRDQLINQINQLISKGAERNKSLENFISWIFSSEFETELKALKWRLSEKEIQILNIETLLWSLRGAVIEGADSAVQRIDVGLLQKATNLKPYQISAFQTQLNKAIAQLKEKFTLVINNPGNETEVVQKALIKFSDLISHLEILLDENEQLQNSDWSKLPGFGIRRFTPQNVGWTVQKILGQFEKEKPLFALTEDKLPVDLRQNLNAMDAEISKLPSALQQEAYETALFLLFKLAELKPERLKLMKGEEFRAFLERNNLNFLANSFGIGQGGTLSLIAKGFVADIARMERFAVAA